MLYKKGSSFPKHLLVQDNGEPLSLAFTVPRIIELIGCEWVHVVMIVKLIACGGGSTMDPF